MPETTSADPDVDSEVVLVVPRDERRRRLILATVLSIGTAAVATALGFVLSRRRAAAGEAAPVTAGRGPVSTINVNWGFALFGTSLMGARGRGPGLARFRRAIRLWVRRAAGRTMGS